MIGKQIRIETNGKCGKQIEIRERERKKERKKERERERKREREDSLFHHMLEDKRRHNRKRNHIPSRFHDLSHCLVVHSDHILTVNFQEVVFNEKSIASGGRVLHYCRDFAVFESEAHVTRTV